MLIRRILSMKTSLKFCLSFFRVDGSSSGFFQYDKELKINA